jgi:hypothetical protein
MRRLGLDLTSPSTITPGLGSTLRGTASPAPR